MPTVDDLLERARDRRTLPPPAIRRALRQEAGLSLSEVAEALHVSDEAVRHWEAGRRRPRPEHLQAYAQLLRGLQRDPG